MDPIKDGLNWYQYASSNPTTYWDPDGKLVQMIFYSGKSVTTFYGHAEIRIDDKIYGFGAYDGDTNLFNGLEQGAVERDWYNSILSNQKEQLEKSAAYINQHLQ